MRNAASFFAALVIGILAGLALVRWLSQCGGAPAC
jgi:hypothetical protein